MALQSSYRAFLRFLGFQSLRKEGSPNVSQVRQSSEPRSEMKTISCRSQG